MKSIISAGLSAAILAGSANALNAVGIKGQDFVDGTTGDRFQLIGMDYQPGGSSGYDSKSHKDPLSDANICRRDAAIMQRIGANTLRVYNLDPTIDHDECASIFNAAGIYMVIDVNSPLPNESINAKDPKTSYNKVYLNRTFQLMDAFRNYPNTLAFFSANELINDGDTGKSNPPYVRAVTRDLHQYMRARGGRVIPIGYSAADVREILADTTNYIACSIDGEANNESKSDFIGVNGYSWCGPDADFTSGKYKELADIYSATTIPVFFSEYGCNEVTPRSFNEIKSIYSKDDMPTFSGGLAYEYTQEDNNYGLVEVKSDTEVKLLDDYVTLGNKFAGIDQNYIKAHNESATAITPPKCDKSLIKSSDFQSSFTLPKQPDGVADMIKNGVSGAGGKGIIDNIDLTLPQGLKVSYSNGSEISDLKLEKKSTGNSLGDTTSASAPGGSGSSSGSSTSKAAGDKITPAAQAGIFVAGLTYMLSML